MAIEWLSSGYRVAIEWLSSDGQQAATIPAEVCLPTTEMGMGQEYKDEMALISIYDNNLEYFTGWFFSKTEELNTYSDKIYEISLLSCE